MATNISFMGYSLQTADIHVNRIQHDHAPSKKQSVFGIARNNKSQITNIQYPQKEINIEGVIVGSTMTDLESKIDAFKLNMIPLANSGNLDIDYNGGTRRYVATIGDLMITRSSAMFKVAFSIQFLCVDPFGHNTTNTTLIGSGTISTASNDSAVSFAGTFYEQQPVVTLVLTSFTGSTTNTISVSNPATGQAVTISEAFVAGQTVIFDFPNKLVTAAGVPVDYSGIFANWVPGSGTIRVENDFTARSIAKSAVHLSRFS